MTFLEQWKSQLDSSLVAFAQLAAASDGIDFTYGILATAVLWPVRGPVQEFDGDVLDAIREIADVKAKFIIRAVQDWSDDPLICARTLASQSDVEPDLRSALTVLIGHFGAAPAFAGHLAQALVKRQGQGDVYNVAEKIEAALVNIGGVTSIQSLQVIINLPTETTKEPRRGITFQVMVVSALMVVIAVVLILGWYILILPMGEGFNIAVARFAVVDDAAPRRVGREFGEWLFGAIEQEVARLPDELKFETRSPLQVGIIEGEDRETRARNAAKVADRLNASILIYGVISLQNSSIQVQPEFYVRGESFGYGSEMIGPEQLGQPVTIDLDLHPAERFELNKKLNVRRKVLQYLVYGLGHFFIREYDKAADFFLDATRVYDLPDSEEYGEGKEVVYLLLGASYLRAYDEITNPDPLRKAEDAFIRAQALNPDYGRSYLGLGAVALEQSKIFDGERTAVVGAIPEKLIQAEQWYSDARKIMDQPATAYVSTKAAYGLAQVHLLAFETKACEKEPMLEACERWSASEAERLFLEVLNAYQAEPVPELAWFAGLAHAYLGRLAAHRRNPDWKTMSEENRTAIEMLQGLPGGPPCHLIARYWAWVALAEEHLENPDEAPRAYQKAIDWGQKCLCEKEKCDTEGVNVRELAKWQEALERLEKGGP